MEEEVPAEIPTIRSPGVPLIRSPLTESPQPGSPQPPFIQQELPRRESRTSRQSNPVVVSGQQSRDPFGSPQPVTSRKSSRTSKQSISLVLKESPTFEKERNKRTPSPTNRSEKSVKSATLSITEKNETTSDGNVPPTFDKERNKLTQSPTIRSEKSIKSATAEEHAEPTMTTSDANVVVGTIKSAVYSLEPQGDKLSEHVNELNKTVDELSNKLKNTEPGSNLEKIAKMSKILTREAKALQESIRTLSYDCDCTKIDLDSIKQRESVDFPYHLFLLEVIVNKIQMKCECFEADDNNLVITATFLGKQPIILYDTSCGRIENFNKINVGKSSLFAMTYDKICAVKEFEIFVDMSKQPPCSHCVTKIAETTMDYTQEFHLLREELCAKWTEEQPKDSIACTTSTPLMKNKFYLSCGNYEREPIGVIEATVRMSFLGKEITTNFSVPKQDKKEETGIHMCSCQKVEMDDGGTIMLDEDVLSKDYDVYNKNYKKKLPLSSSGSPMSQLSRNMVSKRYGNPYKNDDTHKYDEIFTKMNTNELKIRVPKSTKVDRVSKFNRLSEICACEETPYDTGDQIQFEMPSDVCYPDKEHNTYTSNLKYSFKGCDRGCERKDKKLINVTPTNCPVPVDMAKVFHPKKDVFILKIGKKLESQDRKTELEIELTTPKAPEPPVAENVAQQCSTNNLKDSKTDKKKKSKKDKKKKGKDKGAKGKGKGKKKK